MLAAANIRISDLPTIDRHVGNRGENHLCSNHILGNCPHMARGKCSFVHVIGSDLSKNFVGKLYRLVTPGVDSVMNNRNGDNNNNRGDDRGGDVRQ